MDRTCDLYVRALDRRQHEIFQIRKLHHEYWADLQSDGVSHLLAGSRGETATLIRPIGTKSDIDLKLYVKGIEIETATTEGHMYLEVTDNKAFAKVMLRSDDILSITNGDKVLNQIFSNAIGKCPETNRPILLPSVFKKNVVRYCNIDMQEQPKEDLDFNSPAISGQAAVNPYDLVPSLKLTSWPMAIRPEVLARYDLKNDDRTSVVPMFVVPGGGNLSPTQAYEWRLSFSFLEAAIMRQIPGCKRRLYGILKLVFKVLFGDIDLLASYHIKMMFLRKIESDDLDFEKPLPFIHQFLKEVIDAVSTRHIPHYFIPDCNIFPFHKWQKQKEDLYRSRLLQLEPRIYTEIQTLIAHDLTIQCTRDDQWLSTAQLKLESILEAEVPIWYVNSYLTRTLSAIYFCLQKSSEAGKLSTAVESLRRIFSAYQENIHIANLIQIMQIILHEEFKCMTEAETNRHVERKDVDIAFLKHGNKYNKHLRRPCKKHDDKHDVAINSTNHDDADIKTGRQKFEGDCFEEYDIERTEDFKCKKHGLESKDTILETILAQRAFLAYRCRNIADVREILKQVSHSSYGRHDVIGIPLTTFHRNLDPVMSFTIRYMMDKYSYSRVHLHPDLLFLHLEIQLSLESVEGGFCPNNLREKMDELNIMVKQLPDRIPFFGLLSYKHTGIALLKGYKEFMTGNASRYSYLQTAKLTDESDLPDFSMSGNFDMR